MKRIEWIRSKFADRLEAQGEDGFQIPTIDDFVRHDPSRNKRFTAWLIQTYLSSGFLAEDLPKATDTLISFIKHQRKLEASKRDINHYKTLADLWIAIKPFEETIDQPNTASGKDNRRRERDAAYAQSLILADHEGFKAVIPLSVTASRWWGRGTRWCTASERNNQFDHYHSRAPLIIFCLPDGRKMQLFFTPDSAQFMDENDAPISANNLEPYQNFFAPFLLWATKINPIFFTFIATHLINKDLCAHVVSKKPEFIRYIPTEFVNYELCFNAVTSKGEALRYVPISLVDYNLCLAAVKSSGFALQFTPKSMIDRNLCLEAVKQNGEALSLYVIPPIFLDNDLYQLAFDSSPDVIYDLPDSLKTYENYLTYAKGTRIFNFDIIPKQFQTPELILEMFARNPRLMTSHLEQCSLLSNQDVIKLFQQRPLAAVYYPKNLYNSELMDEIINLDPNYIRLLPRHLKDEGFQMKAVAKCGTALRFVRFEYTTYDICLTAVSQDWRALKYVPNTYKTERIIEIATSQCAEAVSIISQELSCLHPDPMAFLDEKNTVKSDWIHNTDFMNSLKIAAQQIKLSDNSPHNIVM